VTHLRSANRLQRSYHYLLAVYPVGVLDAIYTHVHGSPRTMSEQEQLVAPVPAAAPTHVSRPPRRLAQRRWSWSWSQLKPLAGVLLLAAVWLRVDHSALWSRLSRLHWQYVCAGAAIMVPQLLCLAARWRSVAAPLGVHLSLRAATREYALSVLVNQLLPFGVLGDAMRVWRQSQRLQTRDHPLSLALHTVVIERCLGQCIVVVWALLAAPLWLGAAAYWLIFALLFALGACGLSVLIALRARAFSQTAALRPLWRSGARLLDALAQVVRAPRVLLVQLSLSSLIMLSIVAQFYCALYALDLRLPLLAAAKVFPYMMLSMALPLSVAGFGPREMTTVTLYRAAHLSDSDGLAFGLAYGALLLVATLPCFAVWWWLSRGEQVHTPRAGS